MKKPRRRTLYVMFLCLLALFCHTLVYASNLTVAVLKSEGNFPVDDLLAGFKLEMKQNNVSVQLITIEIGHDSDNISLQIVRTKPDLILCIGVKALERAALISKIPKFYAMVTSENSKPWSDRPDVFGVTLDIAPLHQFRIMRLAMPTGKRIGVLFDPELNQKIMAEARIAAAASGFLLVEQPISTIREIPLALQKLENVDMLWAIYDQTAYTPESTRYVLLQSLRKKIPLVGLSSHFAKAGALLAIYGDYSDMGQQLALQAIALSKGLERLPQMSRPRKVRVAINEKVGRLMDVNFSDQFLKTVDQMY